MTEKTSSHAITKHVEYTYDVLDRRIAKDVDSNGDSTFDDGERFVYDGEHIALSFDDGGALEHRYLYGPAIDQLFADEDAMGDVLWALTDNQGTVRDIADYDAGTNTTSIVNHIKYDSFGSIKSETDPNTSSAPTQGSILNGDFRSGYTGREYDPETGQYQYRHRYYDATTGLFLSEDPLGFAAGDTNLQRYVSNSPLNWTDPLGLSGGGSSWNWNEYLGGVGDVFVGYGRGIGNTVEGAIDFVNPVSAINGIRGAINEAPNDVRKAKELVRDPGGYTMNRAAVVGGAIRDKLSTNAGVGEVYVYSAVLAVGMKAKPNFAKSAEFEAAASTGFYQSYNTPYGGYRAIVGTPSTPIGVQTQLVVPSSSVVYQSSLIYNQTIQKGQFSTTVTIAPQSGKPPLTPSQQRSVRSLQKEIDKHRQKLEDYIRNPDAFDNKGMLKNAPTPEIRQSIIDGRIRHLKTELDAFQGEVDRLLDGGF